MRNDAATSFLKAQPRQNRIAQGGRGGQPSIPTRNRIQHGEFLQQQIVALRLEAELTRDTRRAAEVEEDLGLQVEFTGFPDVELVFESLARERPRIELLNVRQEDGRTNATVVVPDGKLNHFESLIRDYLVEKRKSAGRT